jgi:hypothetical protein
MMKHKIESMGEFEELESLRYLINCCVAQYCETSLRAALVAAIFEIDTALNKAGA